MPIAKLPGTELRSINIELCEARCDTRSRNSR
jgi:hypothetical protein